MSPRPGKSRWVSFGLRVEKTAKAKREADSRGGGRPTAWQLPGHRGKGSLQRGRETARRWSGHGGRGNWETVALQQVAACKGAGDLSGEAMEINMARGEKPGRAPVSVWTSPGAWG